MNSSTMVAAAAGGAGREDRDDRREGWALVALAGWLVVTIAWWAAALWPLPTGTPDWVVRARLACFGTRAIGAPDAGGWILLVGTPLGMLGGLVAIARMELVRGVAWLWRSRGGRFLLATVGALVLLCGHLAGVRVTAIYGLGSGAAASAVEGADVVRVDRGAPPLALVAHTGRSFDLAQLAGQPVVVTFAYGKCETVCPIAVHDALAAQAATRELGTAVVVVTLDPWRDTPARLAHVAAAWGLAENGYLLSGSVTEVEESLDAWRVRRARDPRTGEVAHSPTVYVIGPDGQVAYAVHGGAPAIAGAVRRAATQGDRT